MTFGCYADVSEFEICCHQQECRAFENHDGWDSPYVMVHAGAKRTRRPAPQVLSPTLQTFRIYNHPAEMNERTHCDGGAKAEPAPRQAASCNFREHSVVCMARTESGRNVGDTVFPYL